jgi:nifR3 family TIM-barrel protein
MLLAAKEEHPLSMQIFGSTPGSIALSARLAESAGADIVDINAGCPVKKINRSGAGCALMKDEIKLGKLVEAAVKAVKIPVTLKTRIGLTADNFTGVSLAKTAQESGAAAVVMHGRWAADQHAGPAHLEYLAAAAAAVRIPVIGNGGVTDRAGALAVLNTGCKGVMIGRGAIGNPFIFNDIINDEPSVLTPQKRLRLYLDLIKENIAFYGERTGVMRSRKTLGFWVSGFDGASALRVKFLSLETLEDIENLFKGAGL